MRIAVVTALVVVGCGDNGNRGYSDGGVVDSGMPQLPVDAPSPPIDTMIPGCDRLCTGIFVAPNGNDGAAGTKTAPLRTIGAGITKAASIAPREPVYVQVGTYDEAIEMRAGVMVTGGFDASWRDTTTAVTEIVGLPPAVTFRALTAQTALARVTVRSADSVEIGGSSIAVLVMNSPSVELRDVTLLPGHGGQGFAGTNGEAGQPGADGLQGFRGVERHDRPLCRNRARPPGGAGGFSFCSNHGGSGGVPGVGDNPGAAGEWGLGPNEAPGGAGGPGGPESGLGQPGGDGVSGANGVSGDGGSNLGAFHDATYTPTRGSDGARGGDGFGGGAGGGGGGGGAGLCRSTGSSGGGGGGGGCSGTAATGGGGGGGSFGLWVVDSSVRVEGSTITAGTGGVGGAGGNGGAGGGGGAGGAGGEYGEEEGQEDGGMGAAGGRGGNGGNGGHGGGGGGGPSAAIVCLGTTTVTVPSSTLTPGAGGTGGVSLGFHGAIGLSTTAINCSLF